MSAKHLTILVVPHDERNVRRLRLSYRRLGLLATLAGVLLAGVLAAGLSWGRLAARAARSEWLEEENRRLVTENAKVGEIAANLERSEETYQRLRTMAGLQDLRAASGLEAGSMSSESEPPSTDRPPELRGQAGSGPRGWPLTIQGFVTAEYTGREDHPGIDIAVPLNTPVVVTADGNVKQTGSDRVYGQFVVVAHADGYETMYAHNATLLVARDERVERGQIIAYSGNSGQSTAPHLHYEVRREGWPVDPSPFLR